MARLRFNSLGDPTGAVNGVTIANSSATSCSWVSAPGFPTIASPDYAIVIVNPGVAGSENIVYITAFTSGGTSATITQGNEGSTAGTATAAPWVHGPTVLDFNTIGSIPAQNVVPLNLPSWRSSVSNAITGTGSSKILSIGTSLSQGGGVAPNAGTQSFMPYLTSMLNSRLCPAQLTFSIPQPYTATYDSRWTTASGWVLPATNGSQAGIGIGDNGYLNGALSASGTAKYTPGAGSGSVDTFDVWFYGASNTGTFKMNIDGGADTTVVTAGQVGQPGYYKSTITATAGTTHVLNLHTVTVAGVFIIGVDAYLSTQVGLHLGTASIDGIGTSAYYDASASKAAIAAYAPNLTIIELGADDALIATPPTTSAFMTSVTDLIGTCKASGDVVFWVQQQPDPAAGSGPITALTGYVTAMQAYAQANDIAYIDIWNRWGPSSIWETTYDSGDHVHPNASGNADIASAVFRALTSAV